MASTFPGAIDSFTDPLTNSPLNSPSHAGQHQDLNDAVEKVETYMGLVKVIPTGATNGTVGATGSVTIGNAVTSVTVSGAFSSLYSSYRIIVDGGVGSATSNLRLTFGASATGYSYTLLYSTYAAATPLALVNGTASTNFLYAGTVSANHMACNFDVLNPFLNRFTQATGQFFGLTEAGTFAGIHQVSASYADFTIAPAAGTLTGGTIRVYGYRN